MAARPRDRLRSVSRRIWYSRPRSEFRAAPRRSRSPQLWSCSCGPQKNVCERMWQRANPTETLPGVDNSRRDILASCDRSNLSQEEVEGASTTSKGTDITQKSNLFNSHHGHPQRRRIRDNVVGSRSEEHVVVPRRVVQVDTVEDLPDFEPVVCMGAYQI